MRFLTQLAPGEMIAITEQWTGPLQTVFLSIPEIAPLLPRVTEDHNALVEARTGGSAEAILRTLNEQADNLDTAHDHLQRALSFGMRSAREAALGQDPPDTALAFAIDEAQEKLLPNGLDIIKASYEAEAGNAAQMVHLAKNELADILQLIPIAKEKTALDLVNHIGTIGAALGSVEQKKSTTAAEVEKTEITPAEIRRRMRTWAATIETTLGALERSKAPASDIEQLRKPIQDAADKARARRLEKRNKKEKKPE